MNLTVLCILGSCCFLNNLILADSLNYPKVRRNESQIETHFGISVKDPYRWLENPNSQETIDFVIEQNALTQSFLQTEPNRDAIKQTFVDMNNHPKTGLPQKHGSKCFYTHNSGLQNQAVLYKKNTLAEEGTVFLDPNLLSKDGTIALEDFVFSPDGEWCAYITQVGGSDWMTIKIKHVKSGLDLNDTLTKIKFSRPLWTKDSEGFFYGYYDEYQGNGQGNDQTAVSSQKIYYHVLDTNQDQDILVANPASNPEWTVYGAMSDDGEVLHLMPTSILNGAWYYIRLGGKITKIMKTIPIVAEIDARYFFLVNDGNITYMLTDSAAPNKKIIAVDLNKPERADWKTIVEESTDVLESADVIGDRLLVKYVRKGLHVLELRTLSTGQFLEKVTIPDGVVLTSVSRREEPEVFVSVNSLVIPGAQYKLDFSRTFPEIEIIQETKVEGFNVEDFVMKQVTYNSKDGTAIPMFVTHKKGLKLDGSVPALLYAYGGFNVVNSPSFSLEAVFMINNLKGVYATANIRGGGEYGLKWHDAGMGLKRQNFIAAGEFSISNGYTAKDKLTINGRSNGGLLMGVVSNQRPDLFACTIAEVGVMDMLRFHKFTSGNLWIPEYGSPDTETDFKYIYKYSTVHNVPSNVTKYPAMLITTGDHDSRVVPSHSYKFASELQHSVVPKVSTPVLLRIESDAGHGSGKPTSKKIEETADIFSFIVKNLNLKFVKSFS